MQNFTRNVFLFTLYYSGVTEIIKFNIENWIERIEFYSNADGLPQGVMVREKANSWPLFHSMQS